METANNKNGNIIFLATHSTIFSLVKVNSKTFLTTKNSDSTTIKNLTKDDWQNVKEIMGYKNSDIFGYDSTLLVEGLTEERTLPLLGKLIDFDIMEEGVVIFNSKGYGNIVQIDNVLKMLNSTGTKVYTMYDNHTDNQKKLNDIENIIDQNHYLKLQKSFEDRFDGDIRKCNNKIS
jgi:hypothetical protein